MASHFFGTVDAETDVIQEGIQAISKLRDEVEAREQMRIPLVWFVRFQRGCTESVESETPEAMEGPPIDGFDGFALAREQLLELRARGDEIGWHYHAHNYVNREDLSHDTRLMILRADLTSCALELRRRHPCFPIESFRFGWFFVPDYSVYETLRSLGVTRDASIRADYAGKRVLDYPVHYLEPLTSVPSVTNGLSLFPYRTA